MGDGAPGGPTVPAPAPVGGASGVPPETVTGLSKICTPASPSRMRILITSIQFGAQRTEMQSDIYLYSRKSRAAGSNETCVFEAGPRTEAGSVWAAGCGSALAALIFAPGAGRTSARSNAPSSTDGTSTSMVFRPPCAGFPSIAGVSDGQARRIPQYT